MMLTKFCRKKNSKFIEKLQKLLFHQIYISENLMLQRIRFAYVIVCVCAWEGACVRVYA